MPTLVVRSVCNIPFLFLLCHPTLMSLTLHPFRLPPPSLHMISSPNSAVEKFVVVTSSDFFFFRAVVRQAGLACNMILHIPYSCPSSSTIYTECHRYIQYTYIIPVRSICSPRHGFYMTTSSYWRGCSASNSLMNQISYITSMSHMYMQQPLPYPHPQLNTYVLEECAYISFSLQQSTSTLSSSFPSASVSTVTVLVTPNE